VSFPSDSFGLNIFQVAQVVSAFFYTAGFSESPLKFGFALLRGRLLGFLVYFVREEPSESVWFQELTEANHGGNCYTTTC